MLRLNISLFAGCLLFFWTLPVHESVAATVEGAAVDPELQTLIQELKAAPRGPFKRLRWFCNDGAVLPPKVQQLLIEKFFVRYDDGWIFRRARFYRGALHVEDEIASNILNTIHLEQTLNCRLPYQT